MSEGVFRRPWWQPSPRRNIFGAVAAAPVSVTFLRRRQARIYEQVRQIQLRSKALATLTARRSDPLPRVRRLWELYAAAPRLPIPLNRRRSIAALSIRLPVPTLVIRRPRIQWERHQPPRWSLAEKQSKHLTLPTSRTIIPSWVPPRRVPIWPFHLPPRWIVREQRTLETLPLTVEKSLLITARRPIWPDHLPPRWIYAESANTHKSLPTSRTIIPSWVPPRREPIWPRHLPPRFIIREQRALETLPFTEVKPLFFTRRQPIWPDHLPPRWIYAERQSKHLPLPTSRTIIPSWVPPRRVPVWPRHLPPRWAHPTQVAFPLALPVAGASLPFKRIPPIWVQFPPDRRKSELRLRIPAPIWAECPSVRSSATAEITATGTALTITKPPGIITTDVLFALITLADSTDPPALAGWTQVSSQAYDGGIAVVLRRSIRDAEPADYTFTWTGDSRAVGAIVAVANADPNDPVAAVTVATGSGTSVDPPDSGAVSLDSYLAIAFGSQEGKHTSPSWTPPADYQEITDQGITGSGPGAAWCGQSLAYRNLSGITSENPGAFTSVNDGFAAFTLLIRCQSDSLAHKRTRDRWEDRIPPRFIEYIKPLLKVAALTLAEPPVASLVIRRVRVKWERHQPPRWLLAEKQNKHTPLPTTRTIIPSIVIRRNRTPIWTKHLPPRFIVREQRALETLPFTEVKPLFFTGRKPIWPRHLSPRWPHAKRTPLPTSRTIIPSVVIPRRRPVWNIYLPPRFLPIEQRKLEGLPTAFRTIVDNLIFSGRRPIWPDHQPPRWITREQRSLEGLPTSRTIRPSIVIPRRRPVWDLYLPPRFIIRERRYLETTPLGIPKKLLLKRVQPVWTSHLPPRWPHSKRTPLPTSRTIRPSKVLARRVPIWPQHLPPRFLPAEQRKLEVLATSRTIVPSVVRRRPRVQWEQHQSPRWIVQEQRRVETLPLTIEKPILIPRKRTWIEPPARFQPAPRKFIPALAAATSLPFSRRQARWTIPERLVIQRRRFVPALPRVIIPSIVLTRRPTPRVFFRAPRFIPVPPASFIGALRPSIPIIDFNGSHTPIILDEEQELVTDLFTDADGTLLEDHTPDTGISWELVASSIAATIESNQLERRINVFPTFYAALPAPADRGHRITMSIIQDGNGGRVGVISHYNAATFYFATYDGTTFEIGIANPGLVTLVSLVEAAPPEPWTLELRDRYGDDSLRLLVNGVEKLNTSDMTLSGGQSGIYIHGFLQAAILDNFRLVETGGIVTASHTPIIDMEGRLNV